MGLCEVLRTWLEDSVTPAEKVDFIITVPYCGNGNTFFLGVFVYSQSWDR
jgi:hypothetical protein